MGCRGTKGGTQKWGDPKVGCGDTKVGCRGTKSGVWGDSKVGPEIWGGGPKGGIQKWGVGTQRWELKFGGRETQR